MLVPLIDPLHKYLERMKVYDGHYQIYGGGRGGRPWMLLQVDSYDDNQKAVGGDYSRLKGMEGEGKGREGMGDIGGRREDAGVDDAIAGQEESNFQWKE
jgi:hypothetical protein